MLSLQARNADLINDFDRDTKLARSAKRLRRPVRILRSQHRLRRPAAAARRRLSSMPSSSGKGQLAAVGVFGQSLADGGLIAGHVQQVVGDLEGEAELLAVMSSSAASCSAWRRPRCRPARATATISAPVLRRWIASSRPGRRHVAIALAGQVGRLAADQCGRPGGAAQHGTAAARHGRPASRRWPRPRTPAPSSASPTRIAIASPKTLWQVGRPRRRSSSSIAGRSSWTSE